MGSGKSSVGIKLAAALKIPFKDLDSEIEKVEKTSISNIFSEKGEIYFRKVEGKVLKKLLSATSSFVLATGGGTPCYGDSMTYIAGLEDVVSVYIKVQLGTLTSRLFSEKENRPLLAHLKTEDELNDFIRKHLFERAYYYNQSKEIVAVDAENINETVEKIILKLF